MTTIPLSPTRQAELERFAQGHGQTPADALDEAVAACLKWQHQDFEDAVEAIREGHEDVKAGRTKPANEFFAEMRRKYDIPS